MVGNSLNFGFLVAAEPALERLGALAERYFADDPPSSLVKLRQMAEAIARQVAAHNARLPAGQATFDEVLRILKTGSLLPHQVSDLFHHLRRAGNAAAHEHVGTPSQALNALKIARSLAVWYHQSYLGAPAFNPGAFIPPQSPVDATKELEAELEGLRKQVRASNDAEAKARLKAEEAETAARTQAEDKTFWESYAAETEVRLEAAKRELGAVQAQAALKPPEQLQHQLSVALRKSEEITLDEASTRVIIDAQLRAVGWETDTALLRHAKGARPQYGKNMAIAEWPTKTGPVDYALFMDGRCVGVIEAKRQIANVPGHLRQSKRYASGIKLEIDHYAAGAPWQYGAESYQVPFLFVTNGRPYVKQLETKSGIWFWDSRLQTNQERALSEWLSPRDLAERLEQQPDNMQALAERELGIEGLRPYQEEAIRQVENAIARGQQEILLAMATGTGKTRLAIALMYELLKRKRFRRILFLVDRNALGRQTLDAMSTTEASGFHKFDQIFPVADLAKKFPEATDRVQVATVQAMVKRIFDSDEITRPTPGTYDLIIVDEAHRGYTLDAELREEDLDFRNLEDYLSAYRRVLDYFDATRVALTATPALHTLEMFGRPVFHYGYRQAVIDGFLIDHRPPRRITTELSQSGITFEAGDEVDIIDSRTGQLDLFTLPDQVDFEVTEFNKKVYTRAFNREVARAIAQECPPTDKGKTLLFAARDDHADILVDELRKALNEEYGEQPHDLVEKITGKVDRPLDRIKVFKNDPRPKYVVTVDLLTTGIDIPAITNLVFVRRVNSRILYDQMIGRATRLCDDIGKEYFRIFDAVDIYANLQAMSDMHPVVVNPALSLETLVQDLQRAPTDADRAVVRDQIVVKLRGLVKRLDDSVRDQLETVLGPLPDIVQNMRNATPEDMLALFNRHPSLAATLDTGNAPAGPNKILISTHEDALLSVEDNFGNRASPEDYIESFVRFVRENMNAVPALIAATQKPRELTRKELKDIAILLDEKGFSEAALRQAYGRTRNADISAHIIGFVRQAAIGDPLVPYATRVENGLQKIMSSHPWTAIQQKWLRRIGRALQEQPVGDPAILAEPAFLQDGGFTRIDEEFDGQLALVLKDLNAAIWGTQAA